MDGSWVLGSFNTSYYVDGGPVSNISFSQRTFSQSVEITGRVTTPVMDGSDLSKIKFDMKIILIEPSTVTTSDLRSGRINIEDMHEVEKYFKLDQY